MKFTTSQSNAVNISNKTLLVSAGAGSGKTTVLTHRLIDRIKKGGDIRRFLVVTFMKAAASDIKRKLYDELLKEFANNPEDTHLFKQSNLIGEANICTISAYCLALVKENFSVLGISPRVRVIDETESAMLLHNAADELISKGYDEESPSFLLLADNFTGDKNDSPLADSMIKLYNSLRVTLDYEKMLVDCEKELRKEAEITRSKGFFASEMGKEMQSRLKSFYDELYANANSLYEYAANVAEEDKYLAPIGRFLTAIENVRDSVETNYANYCAVAEASLKSITLARSGCDADSRKIISEWKSKIVKTEKDLYERYCRGNEDFVAESFEQSADVVSAVREFICDLDKKYKALKTEISALDYSDFEAKALELLETTDADGNHVPTELCLKKQQSFDEILIDEYQDVNPMQDRIFTLLSGGSHRFMVGDVKQSIYRFRNAYPDIFINYKESFPDAVGSDNSKNGRIFLRENFRCSQNVIDYVNHVFLSVTEGTPYYREYDGEWLIHASDKIELNHPVIVAISDKEKGKSKESRQSEAEYIAKEIRDLVYNQVSDEGKPYKFSDVAVMLGAMKGYSIEYEKAFRKYGIPYKTETSENFLENPDIRLAVSALKAIDDPTDDISLCSLMRSPICNFDSNDLYRIRTRIKDTSFWNAVSHFAFPERKRTKTSKFRFTSRYGRKTLCARCRDFVKTITLWRSQSSGVPCQDFLKSFFASSGMLDIATASGTRESLLLLFEYARKYEIASNHGLSGFLDYISELSKGGKEISDASRFGDEDAVSFITVHKSKGLEFKICFLAGIEKKFMGMKSSSDITLLRGKGIYFRLRDRGRLTNYNPLSNIIAADREREAIFGEELRKLYVALTRAKERLYITGSAEIGWQEKEFSKLSAKSWLDLILYVNQLGQKSFFVQRTIEASSEKSGYISPLKSRTVKPTKEMLDIINFKYPYSKSINTAAKISVSELREGLLEDGEYNQTHLSVPKSRVSLKPDFAQIQKNDFAEIGTANHLFMQFADFESAEISVESEAKRLLSNRMITDAQYEMLDFSALQKFFQSDVYSRIKKSPKVYREKRFSVRDILSENDEPILVQGVIDCFFQNPDGTFTIVDYKTDRVKTLDELVDRHRFQLSVYKKAVERMTGNKVSESLLYSFALNREIKAE